TEHTKEGCIIVLSENPTFALFALGVSGGPVESRVTGFLLSPLLIQIGRSSSSPTFISFDPGVLLHGIINLLSHPNIHTHLSESPHFSSILPLSHKTAPSPFLTASRIHQSIHAHLISHPHLDHISALAINSQSDAPLSATSSNSAPQRKKLIVGLPETLRALAHNLFNDVLWPNVISAGLYSLHPVGGVSANYDDDDDDETSRSLEDEEDIGVSVEAFEVTHGAGVSGGGRVVVSTCFFVGASGGGGGGVFLM
ncbi:hypothetical protein HK100_010628, partial [Physocladia obscura]